MSDIKTLITEVENKWLQKMYKQVSVLFEKNPIPSHSEDHHLRVWHYSLMLIEELHSKNIRVEASDLENLIIAVFFHDTGMVLTPGPDHGRSGKNICEKWLEDNSLKEKVDSEKILHAIHQHDNKEYLKNCPLSSKGRINLPGILGISDDLDAFGFTGIYRYTEIYLLRGSALEELGRLVLSNICRRFENFLQQCGQFPALIRTQTIRYEITRHFFEHYNSQLSNEPSVENIARGPYSIVRFIHKQLLLGISSVEKLCENGINYSNNRFEKEFFENLHEELKINYR